MQGGGPSSPLTWKTGPPPFLFATFTHPTAPFIYHPFLGSPPEGVPQSGVCGKSGR